MSRLKIGIRLLAALTLCVAVEAQSGETVVGAGSTFSAPIYQKWIEAFQTAHLGAAITYEAVGSEAGIRRLQEGKADFAAADFPPSEDLEQRVGFEMLPTVIGGVVPVYNIPGLQGDLRFTPDILAGIYLGQITKWNDAKIKAINHSAHLPEADIVVIHRSEGSGTTYVWSDFLSKCNAQWKSSVGIGSTLQWPVGQGAKGNDGVAQLISSTPNSIGYVEFIYALQNRLNYAAVANSAGQFVAADIDSLTAAAASAQTSPTYRISITNAPGKEAYPIASFTWVLVPTKLAQNSEGATAKRQRLIAFLDWALTSGQRQAAALGYVALPKALAERERSTVTQLNTR